MQMIMHFNEIHKFSDGTLQQINEALDYRVKEFKVNKVNLGLNTEEAKAQANLPELRKLCWWTNTRRRLETSSENRMITSSLYQIFTKGKKTKLNRTRLSTDLEKVRKTEAKGLKGLKTELKQKFPDRLDNVCAFNEVKTSQSQPRDTALERASKTKPENINCQKWAHPYWNGYLRKGRKTKPKRQNRTRNGKDKVKTKP
ncbi:hypothetical protein Tco_1544398, partial [Tanacetum coccineum]